MPSFASGLYAAVALGYLGPVAPSERPFWERPLQELWAEPLGVRIAESFFEWRKVNLRVKKS